MTAMPEAGLARELGLPYASVCVVVNRAAGRGDGDIHGQLARYLDAGMAAVDNLLRCYFSGN
jgi:purine nucleoside phosphorylase